jgi:hypothetical protein
VQVVFLLKVLLECRVGIVSPAEVVQLLSNLLHPAADVAAIGRVQVNPAAPIERPPIVADRAEPGGGDIRIRLAVAAGAKINRSEHVDDGPDDFRRCVPLRGFTGEV